jgi:hypothetical protein
MDRHGDEEARLVRIPPVWTALPETAGMSEALMFD